MSTHLDTSLKPPGRGDGSNATAEAQHSADIADQARTAPSVAMLALGALLGVALSVLTYLAVVRIVHDTVGPAEQRVINDIRTPLADKPTDKDAGPGGIDEITPGRDAPTPGR
jgi:hypothetical protein